MSTKTKIPVHLRILKHTGVKSFYDGLHDFSTLAAKPSLSDLVVKTLKLIVSTLGTVDINDKNKYSLTDD